MCKGHQIKFHSSSGKEGWDVGVPSGHFSSEMMTAMSGAASPIKEFWSGGPKYLDLFKLSAARILERRSESCNSLDGRKNLPPRNNNLQ